MATKTGVGGERVTLPDGAVRLRRAARRVALAGRPVTLAELVRTSGMTGRAAREAAGRLREAGLWRWGDVAGLGDDAAAPGSGPARPAYGSLGVALLAAADAVLARCGRLTTRALMAETGASRPNVSSRVHSLKKAGRWPHRLLPDLPERCGRPPGRLRAEVEARWADQERAVLEAAPRVADAEGRLALPELVAASGLDYDPAWHAVKRLRGRGEWPYRARKDAPPPEPDPDVVREVDRERRAMDAVILAGMGDGRHEVDDPVENGWLAVPRSNWEPPPPPPPLAAVCRRYLREWRAIRRPATAEAPP